MNRGIRLRTALVAMAALCAGVPASAQIEDNLGGLDATNAERYLEPLPAAFSGALNTAIFRTGDIPKAGLTVQFGVEAMIVAYDDDLTSYQPQFPDGFTPADDSDYFVPTVIGNEASTTVEGEGGLQVSYPGGFDIENFAVAVPQLTVGSFMGTSATIRYIALDLGDAEIGDLELFGFGLQHSLTQYLVVPGPKPVDVAVGFFYQSFRLGTDDLIKSNALHLNATASRSFGLLQPYVGVGFDTYSFEVNYRDGNDDKISVEFDDENSLHLTLGAAASFGLAHLHAEMNFASAIGIAAGLSVGL